MSEDKKIFMDLLADLERAYNGSAHRENMDYIYGFMDALAVVRQRIAETRE